MDKLTNYWTNYKNSYHQDKGTFSLTEKGYILPEQNREAKIV